LGFRGALDDAILMYGGGQDAHATLARAPCPESCALKNIFNNSLGLTE
jgi:hypothetical protein